VFQAQRDLAQARNDELNAILSYNRAEVDLETVQVAPVAGANVSTVATATSGNIGTGITGVTNATGTLATGTTTGTGTGALGGAQ
jgi:hypothetical protein